MNACVENASPFLSDHDVVKEKQEGGIKPPLHEETLEYVSPVQSANRAEIAAALAVAPTATDATTPEKRAWFPARWMGRDKARAAENSPHIVHVDVDAFFASVEQC